MFNLLYVTPRWSFLKKTLIVGYFDRKKENFKDILDRFFLISFTCFVKKSLHLFIYLFIYLTLFIHG